jgi:hypothetical protein
LLGQLWDSVIFSILRRAGSTGASTLTVSASIVSAPTQFDRFGANRFNRFGFNRFGFNRFGFNRFGFNRFGSNRFGSNRFGSNRFGGNQLLVDGWGGWGWDGWGGSASTGASEPIIVGDGAPVIINIGADPRPRDGGAQSAGGCVIHKLLYDSSGKYVGERQIPQC